MYIGIAERDVTKRSLQRVRDLPGPREKPCTVALAGERRVAVYVYIHLYIMRVWAALSGGGRVYSACKGTGAYDEINNFRATGHEPRGFAVFDTLLYYAAATPVTAGPRRPPFGVWVAGPAAAGARTRPRTNTHARLSLAERRPVPPT